MSEYGIPCIAMDTTPASPADDHSIAVEPHVATCSDLDAWASMAFVFLLEIAMCPLRGEAPVAYIQWHDRFGSESPLQMSVLRASSSPAFNQEEKQMYKLLGLVECAKGDKLSLVVRDVECGQTGSAEDRVNSAN